MNYIRRITAPRAYAYYISDEWYNSVTPHPTQEQLEQNIGPTHEEILAAIESHEISFTINMTTEGDTLKFKLTNNTENKIVYNFSVDMTTFFNAYAQSLWVVNDDVMDSAMWKEEEVALTSANFYDTLSQTYNSKSKTMWSYKTLFAFYVRADAGKITMNDIDVIVIEPRALNYTPPAGRVIDPRWDIDTTGMVQTHHVNYTGNVQAGFVWQPLLREDNNTSFLYGILDVPQLTASKSGDVITVDVDTRSKIDYVYVETNSGILPKSKISLDANGNGSFKVLTTGLDTGDQAYIKVGYKNISNANHVSVTV